MGIKATKLYPPFRVCVQRISGKLVFECNEFGALMARQKITLLRSVVVWRKTVVRRPEVR